MKYALFVTGVVALTLLVLGARLSQERAVCLAAGWPFIILGAVCLVVLATLPRPKA